MLARKLLGTCLAAALAAAPAGAARRERLALRHVALDLPGPPARIVASDLDGDGRRDLLVVVAYTEVESVGAYRVEEMVQVATVVPALLDRRELRAYLAIPEGGFREAGPPLALPPSVLHLEAGPPGVGVIALTDAGVARVTLGPAGQRLRIDPLIDDPPLLAHTGSFYAELRLVHELNGDGIDDLLLPGLDGLGVYLGTTSGIARVPSQRLALERRRAGDRAWPAERELAWPEVEDVSGDGVADLVYRAPGPTGDERVHVLLGSREGRFRPIRDRALDCHDELSDLRFAGKAPGAAPWPADLVALRDLDGDGRAEAVIGTERSRGESFRKELKDAKRPIQQMRFHRLRDDLSIEPEPYYETEVVGHTLDSDGDELPIRAQQFADLDGDGRDDLVTLTLDFSIFQALKILMTKKIGIGMDFHVYAQDADGAFHEVPGLDLSEKLKLDLNDLQLGRFAQFAGDFDGDGRQDFVHLGRERTVTIHTGRPGCRYPREPDLVLELDEPPPTLNLVRVEDLDGDGLSDLRVTRPLPATDPDATAPVRVDLYLSGSGS